jgi:hypothetical protein
MADYEISKTAGTCSACGRTFAEGESFYSVVYETPEGFERRDIAEDCWQGPPEDAFCHFKTRLPKKEAKKRKRFVDDNVLIEFFRRLDKTEDAQKLRFRFVLSLILLRKRVLKYEGTHRDDAGEFWDMRLVREKTIHRVFNPSMNESEIESLTRELGVILEGEDFDDDDAESGEGEEADDAETPVSAEPANGEED